jgi:squalene synthase HpnC
MHTMSAVASVTIADLPAQEAVMEQAGRENFTVASALLGRDRRRHLMAIYGFARLVDDVGDELAGDRSALLDVVEAELDCIYAGECPRHPVMTTLAESVSQCELPAAPFRRLLEANRWDQRVTRYESFEQLLAYCQLSAAPVGELVLSVFRVATPERVALSDRICAGLQITEHLQDVDEDFSRGRIYLPREDRIRFGCDDDHLPANRSPSRRALIAFEAQRAHSLLSSGAPLARTLPARPRIAVSGFLAGGRAALDALQAAAHERRVHPRAAFGAAFLRSALGR